MPEILTESFCERCGTRYTFESAAPTKTQRLGKFKTTAKGLRNYVMSDDTSLDEAMAAARSDDERATTTQQLDAFHSTFNFCMNCRQYTCANCWNDGEGQCLTCSPHLGHEIMPAPFPDLPVAPEPIGLEAWPETDLIQDAAAEPEPVAEFDVASRLDRLSGTQADAIPTWLAAAEADQLASAEAQAIIEAIDEPEVPIESVAAAASIDEPVLAPESVDVPAPATPEPAFFSAEPVVVESEPVAAAPEPERVAAETQPITPAAVTPIAADAEPLSAEADEVDDRAAAAVLQTSALLAKFRPGQSIDAELEAYEAAMAAEEARAADGELAIAAAAVIGPDVEPEPEVGRVAALGAIAAAAAIEREPAVADVAPIAARAEPEPEPIASQAEPEPVAEPIAAAFILEPVAEQPEPEHEPVAAQAEPEPEPVAAQAEPEPVAAAPLPEPEPVAAAAEPTPEPAREDVVEQPTWRIVAPDPTVAPTNGHVPEGLPAAATAIPVPPPQPAAAPEWPTSPQWPQPNPALLSQRAVQPSAAMEALWAASVRDVVAPAQNGAAVGGVQSCNSCGLSLSANARFCRRCGTRQG